MINHQVKATDTRILRELRNWCIVFLGAFLIAFLVNSKAYAKAEVKHSSMENTLFEGQQVIEDEISYNFSNPKRGDIIIFLLNENKGTLLNDLNRYIDTIVANFKHTEASEKHERLVKRVIGVEGDRINIKDGSVYVNDKKLDEPYVKGVTYPNDMDTPVTVGKNELFVMGDNREVSIDSREFGFVKLNQVEGKVIYRIYPFNHIGTVK